MVYINDQSFLHSVYRTVTLKLLTVLGTRKKGENYDSKLLFQGIDSVLQHYNKADILISFKKWLIELEEGWDIKMHFCLPGDHVLDIKTSNRVLS